MDPLEHIIGRAKADPKHIVLPEGLDDRIVEGAVRASKHGIAEITLLGPVDKIRPLTRAVGDDKDRIRIIDPGESSTLDFANEMVRGGTADGSVAGAVHATSDVVRSALRLIGMDRSSKILSSLFLMIPPKTSPLPYRGLIFSDCALVVDPNARKLAGIASAAAKSASLLLDAEPKVAMLSFATGKSAQHALVDKVEQATQLLKSRQPDLPVEGPVQFDAAIIPEIAGRKLPGSKVSGQANVLIFPDLNAGNIGYKIAERIGGAKAIGPIMQGFKRPANDLSRGCDADDVFNMIAVTVLQAQFANKNA